MNLYVVRHGQTDYNKANLFQGRQNIELNDNGLQQASELAKKLQSVIPKEEIIDKLLVSPLTRAIQTAEPISKTLSIPITLCDDLIERSYGNMEGKANRPDWNNIMMLDYDRNYTMENIEPIQDVFKRVYHFLDQLIGEYSKIEKDQENELTVILVTHACITLAIECYINGEPSTINFETTRNLMIENAEFKKYIGVLPQNTIY